jgi:hypothetical protein
MRRLVVEELELPVVVAPELQAVELVEPADAADDRPSE